MKKLPESFADLTKSVFAEDGKKYPAKTLVEMELRPGFERSKNCLLPHMIALNEAHLVMLCEQEIINEKDGAYIMKEMRSTDYEQYKNRQYTGAFEDLFFEIEHDLIARTNGLGANVHLARSRNDMSLCLARMSLREEALRIIEKLIEVHNSVRLFAEEHKNTLYVVHTHTQHAQPGVLGHYFLGYASVLDRDIIRFQNAYNQINCSPMGAAAITTSGFPINRRRVADLLGFKTLIENSYDAIGNIDFFTETAAAVSLAALNLGRVISDMITWATEELHMIRLADGYISTSSIMPQKRNPIALEHLRCSLAVVKGLADAVMSSYAKTPYGDVSDHEDVEEPLSNVLHLFMINLNIFNSVLGTLEVDRELLKKRAQESFSVVTEIADELYRSFSIPFRQAHHITASLVKAAEKANLNIKTISADFFAHVFKEVTGTDFSGDFEIIRRSMDPEAFVRCREVEGGTGPAAMKEMLENAEKRQRTYCRWHDAQINDLAKAAKNRKVACEACTTGVSCC